MASKPTVRFGRPPRDSSLNVRHRHKPFYFPISKEYDIVWHEFIRLSIIKCEKEPKLYRHIPERRVGYMLRRLVFAYVGKNTTNEIIKAAVDSVLDAEVAENKAAYKKDHPNYNDNETTQPNDSQN